MSPEVAGRMALGVRRVFRTTFGLSTTGVAGPTGGTRRTPVGLVFIGFSDGKRTRFKRFVLKGTRREIKKEAAEKALSISSRVSDPPCPSPPAIRLSIASIG